MDKNVIKYIENALKEILGNNFRIYRYNFFKQGNSHLIYILHTNQGKLALKILKSNRDVSVLSNTIKAHNILQKIGLTHSEVITYNICPKKYSLLYIIHKFIEGDDLETLYSTLNKEDLNRIFYDLGVYLRLMHTYKANHFSKDISFNKTFDSWESFLIERLEKEMKFMIDTSMATQPCLEHIETSIRNMVKDISFSTISPTFVHRDIHPANILIRNKKFVSLIDFEISWFSDPLWDFNKLDVFFFNNRPELKEKMLDGYNINNRAFKEEYSARLNLNRMFEYMWAFRNYYVDKDYDTSRFYLNLLTKSL
ncbi:aminoglycoside phosphotransferase family protein [Lysinibacillus sphaericus]|uniref:aminoglycoside phosphotransferase family protein n=1 Tax=Lysinibacillus sphaericus TaxID=1421 RepID=UPI001910B028|nr:aminoglycoside phosphotransferase family protein [Lysinibacillus sphaericus]QPA52716.1 aminoglycoside phosphotransferase family protein [Lysinibacillus sphaericus]